MGVRTMYDSVTPEAIPLSWNPQIVAGYIDGHYRSFDGLAARFPNAIHVPIAVFASTNGGLVLDCENGDATPAQAPGWVKMRLAAGVVRPTVYAPSSEAPAVQQACSAAGLRQNVDWALGVAQYDNKPTPTGHGEVFKQYIDHGPGGENVDLSAVFDDAWPFYALTPIPVPDEEDEPVNLQPGDPTATVDVTGKRLLVLWSDQGARVRVALCAGHGNVGDGGWANGYPKIVNVGPGPNPAVIDLIADMGPPDPQKFYGASLSITADSTNAVGVSAR